MADEHESASARVIAKLAAEAEHVDDGKFTLDLDRASAKLGMFALAEPEAWTLLLVEVGALLGAEDIEFELGPRRATVRFDAAALTTRELDGLSARALSDVDEGPDQRRALACRQLARADLALRAREAAVELVSEPAGERPCRLRFARGEQRFEILAADEASQPGSDRLRIEVDFGQRDPTRAANERRLLQARCGCARVSLRVDGWPFAKGWSGIFGNPTQASALRVRTQFEIPIRLAGRTVGTAGYHLSERHSAFVRVLVNGVAVEDVPLDAYDGYRAVVEADLRRDLSQGRLLRDDRFADMLAAVHAAEAKAEAKRDELRWPERSGPQVPEPPPWWTVRRHWVWAIGLGCGSMMIRGIVSDDELALSSALALLILMWMASTLTRDS